MSERRIGILIASSRFPEESKLEDLRFPENDVDGLNEILTSQDHGQFTQTFLLKNKLHHEILLKINQVLREADKNDLVLIYYSGHGKLNPAGKLHLTSTDSVINALEATSIPVSTIRDYVDISSSNKIVLILDCCFSGAAGEAFARGGVDDQLHLVSGGRGTYILTASTGIQVAQEKESDQYGVFTKHLIEGIKSGEADLDSDGRITMGDLYRYVHDKVLDEGFQEPMKWDLNVRGEMVIARSGKTPWAERRKKILKLLYSLAADSILPDDILDKARQVIALEPDQLSEEDRTYDRLLDQLLKKRLEPVEFIRKWDKVRPGKPDLQTKEQKELKRKTEEEKRRKEEEDLKQKAEEERKRTEAKRKEVKAEFKPNKPGPVKVKPHKPKPVSAATTESEPSEPNKISRALKFGVLIATAILLTIVGYWLFPQQQVEEVRQEIEKLDSQVLKLQNAIAEINKPEQIMELYRQRDTLSQQVEGFSEQAAQAGLGMEMEELQNRLNQIQIQLANKETELKENEFIKDRQTMEKLDRQVLKLQNAIAEINKPEQIEVLSRQRNTLSHQAEGFSEQASKAGMELQLEDLQNRLEQVPIQLANKEKELIAARNGKIFVESFPENATVKILNNDDPFQQGMELEPGKYHVQLSSEGYEPQDRWIQLGPGEEKRIDFELKKIILNVAWLHVETFPEDARVRILNIKPKFVQGLELEPGNYHVEVAAEGYETKRQWIDLVVGQGEPFRFELAKIKVAEPISPQKTITNSIGMKFALIPAGSFIMGSQLNPEEVARRYEGTYYKEEHTLHPVEITKPFYLQTTEISQGHWKRVMGNNPSKFKDCGNDCPVESVSWDDAQKFISKLNQMEGTNKYRLPTEAEWEYACRSETTTPFFTGECISTDQANYNGTIPAKNCPKGEFRAKTVKVDSFQPNTWGLYSMHGNVWEWVQDWYSDYPSNLVVDPEGPDKGYKRMIRGGAWDRGALNIRSAQRTRNTPDYRSKVLGFRVARDF